MKRKRIVLLTTFLIVMACLVIGYAALQTTLNITGNTNIQGNSWDVHWANVQVNEESTAEEVTPATITEPTQVEFNINLNAPGDYYEFTVDAVNAGTIDVMLDGYTMITLNGSNAFIPLPSYLTYEVTYVDGLPFVSNQLLAANSTETYKVRIEYKRDITEDDLVGVDTTIKYVFSTSYLQSDEDSVIPVRRRMFSYPNGRYYQLSPDMTDLPTTYDSPEEVMTQSGYPFFVRYTAVQNSLYYTEVGFQFNGNIYYLKGGINEQNLTKKPTFENNKRIMQNIFGNSNCQASGGSNPTIHCLSDSEQLEAIVYASGNVSVNATYYPYNQCLIKNNISSSYGARCGHWID